MTSVQAVREFINERLTAAAGEIFTVFEQTIIQYETELDRQRKLLEIIWKPQIKLHRAELPQHHYCREEQLLKWGEPERPHIKEEPEKPGLPQFKEEPEPPQIREEQVEPTLLLFQGDQEEPEPSQIEEHEELCTSRDGEQLLLNFEADAFTLPSIEEQSYLSEPEEVLDTEQFLSHDSEVHSVKKYMDSESTINAELKKLRIFHSDHVENFSVSEKQAECEILLCGETRGETVRKKHKLYPNFGTVTDKKKISQQDVFHHMETHTSEKPYFCESCGKSFSRRFVLMRHMKAHTGVKPYSCKTCGKSFSRPSILMSHMRIHTSEKPYSCETCGKAFSVQGNLLVHRRTHTGEKPYSCKICVKGFSQQNHLLVHMRTHTGEKPYLCKICGKSFSQQNNLSRHMKVHR